MTYTNYKTILEWPIKTKKMKSVTRQQQQQEDNKYTGTRDDDSSSKNTYVCKPSNFDHNYDTIHIHTVSRSMFLRITFCTRNFIKNCCAKDKLCLVFWELFSRPQCLYFGINSLRSKNIIQLWKLLENAGKNKKSSVRHQKLKAGSKQTGSGYAES